MWWIASPVYSLTLTRSFMRHSELMSTQLFFGVLIFMCSITSVAFPARAQEPEFEVLARQKLDVGDTIAAEAIIKESVDTTHLPEPERAMRSGGGNTLLFDQGTHSPWSRNGGAAEHAS